MSVQVTLSLEIKPQHLNHLHRALAEVFGARNVQVLPGLLGTSEEHREAIARALKGQGLPARAWQGPIRGAVMRVPAGTPGVSRFGDLVVAVEGTPDRPVIRLSYDRDGTRQELIGRVLQEYAVAVSVATARAHGGRIQRKTTREDGSIVLRISLPGGGI